MPTIGDKGNTDKDIIRHALMGEIPSGDGYEQASREDCGDTILEILDSWVILAQELAASGRAMERLMERHGFLWKHLFREYMALHTEESGKYQGYLTEGDLAELSEAIDDIEGGGDDQGKAED